MSPLQTSIGIIIILGLFGVWGQQAPYVSVHKDPYCTTNNENNTRITKNMTAKEDRSDIDQMFYGPAYLAVNGIWSFQSCQIESSVTKCWPWEVLQGVERCTPFNLTVKGRSIRVKRFGNEFQNATLFTYFTLHDFLGDNVTISADDDNSNLPVGNVGSYFFSGDTEWAWYQQNNFQGEGNCLKPDPSVSEKKYGMTFNRDGNFVMRSIAKDCTNHEITTARSTTERGSDRNQGTSKGVCRFLGIILIFMLLNLQ